MAGALEDRAGLAHPHPGGPALLVGGPDDAEGGAVADAGEGADQCGGAGEVERQAEHANTLEDAKGSGHGS